MKKVSLFLVLALSLFVVAGSAVAVPFVDLEGYVNPNGATTTLGTFGGYSTTEFDDLQYTFVVVNDYSAVDDGVPTGTLSELSLFFESDVFVNQSKIVVTSITDGWTAQFVGNEWLVAAVGTGDELVQGQTLTFTLDNVELYTAALTAVNFTSPDGNWSQGQIWSQTYSSEDTGGGSTAVIPEPASMLLLGSGLVGLAGLCRRRYSKKRHR